MYLCAYWVTPISYSSLAGVIPSESHTDGTRSMGIFFPGVLFYVFVWQCVGMTSHTIIILQSDKQWGDSGCGFHFEVRTL